MKFYCLLIIGITLRTFGQPALHHQMLSSHGLSKELINGMFVSQTVGQQSIVGNATTTYTIQQGFQQSIWSKLIATNSLNEFKTTAYPNPFVETIHFQFSKTIEEPISITLFDVRGRIVLETKQKIDATFLTLELPQIPNATYLIHLSANNYNYYTQIIKK